MTPDGHCQIAAVVPTHNRRDLLKRCVSALLDQTRPVDEIVVVDNASDDGTQEMIREEFPQRVTVIRLRENAGSAGGFHDGIRYAYERGYDWFWAMDNDAEAEPDALRRLTENPAFTDPRVGLLSSLVVGTNHRVQASHHLKLTALMREVPATGETYPNDLSVRLEAKSYTGSLIRRSVIETIGLPNKDFFAYYDDLDYSCRIRRQFDLFLIPASRVTHADGKIAPRIGMLRYCAQRTPFEERWKTYYSLRNNTFLVTRHARTWALPAVLVRNLISTARSVCGVLALDDHKAQRTKLLLRAWRDGLFGRLGKVTDL